MGKRLVGYSRYSIFYVLPLEDGGSRNMKLALSKANGHITLNTPVLVRSLKFLSNVESSQYLDG